eukprot:c21788_g1_i1 orf=397-1500(+)
MSARYPFSLLSSLPQQQRPPLLPLKSLHSLLSGDGIGVKIRTFPSLRRLPHLFVCSPFLAVRFPSYPSSRVVCNFSASQLRSAVNLQAVDNLPPKLKEIVKLFEVVPDPRAKYEQLLHYGKRLKPLAKAYQTTENKVVGCVSQVWVRAFLGLDNNVYYEAESDSLLTKGLAALLVEGLSGSSPSEILTVSPDFIQILGLKQSLTPSRSNGFFNMLKLMQKKALQVYMEAQGSAFSQDSSPTYEDDDVVASASPQEAQELTSATEQGTSTKPSGSLSRKQIIMQKLESSLDPILLEVEDVSYQHAGHAGVEKGSTETHFNVKIVSSQFEGRTLIRRHRMVYDLLQEQLQNGLHALSIVAKTPEEMDRA